MQSGIVLASAWLALAAPSSAARFAPLDFEASALSADGYTVVGRDRIGPVRWNRDIGKRRLGNQGGNASGVSADGSTVVGEAWIANRQQAFRWTRAEGLVSLGLRARGYRSDEAVDVSDDAGFVTGYLYDLETNSTEAFLWRIDGELSFLRRTTAGRRLHRPRAISADGSTVVGRADDDLGLLDMEAFRWTLDEGIVGLGAGFGSAANDVSADGSTVVGVRFDDSVPEAFRWTPTEGLVGLGDLAGLGSSALGVSADGSIVVGTSSTPSGPEAVVWDGEHGLQELDQYLARAGLGNVIAGWQLTRATAISADGAAMIGMGYRTDDEDRTVEFWYLAVPEPSDPGAAAMLALALLARGVSRSRGQRRQARLRRR